MTDEVAKFAASLTKAQQEAVLAPNWSARQQAGLIKRGLCYWSRGPHGKPMVKFRQIGLAVRAYLEEQQT